MVVQFHSSACEYCLPTTVYWRDYSFPMEYSWLPCQIWVDCICMDLFYFLNEGENTIYKGSQSVHTFSRSSIFTLNYSVFLQVFSMASLARIKDSITKNILTKYCILHSCLTDSKHTSTWSFLNLQFHKVIFFSMCLKSKNLLFCNPYRNIE